MQTSIEQIATDYPHLAETFAHIPQGEAHLRRLQDLNDTWQNMLLSGENREYAEVVVTEDRPALPAIDTFDIIYAGGGLNLLNAAVMTVRYGLRVLVFDRFTVGAVHREWNISREELRELLDVGLLTPDELESVIQREYSDGLVRFHPANIKVKPAELHLKNVLDVAVDAEKLTAFDTLIQRLNTGNWSSTSPELLNKEAASFGANLNPVPPAFLAYTPTPFLGIHVPLKTS